MAGENSLVFQIGADLADLQRKLSEAKGHLKSFADEGAAPVEASLQQISRSFEQLGSKLTSIGTTLSVAITAPLVGVGVAAVNVAGEFGSAMNKVKANLDDVTVNGIKQLDLLAQQLGAKTKFSALEAAQGMGEFAAAGYKTNEIMQVMAPTMDLAAAAQTNVATAAGITKDILGQFGLKASDAKMAMDVLAKAGTESSGTLEEVALSLTYVGPVAKTAGMDIQQTVAALVELDKAGLRGEKAGRAMRDMLSDLAAPTKGAQKLMAELGITVTDAQGKFLPFSTIMENFRVGLEKTSSNTERLATLTGIFGKETLSAADILTRQGAPALLDYEQKIRNSSGAVEQMAKTMNEGMKGGLEQLRGSLETAGIALGQALEPAIVSIAKTLQNFVDNTVVPAINWFKQLPEPVQIGALALTAMAAAAGPLLIVAGQLASAIGSLTALFVPAATGATAAGTAFGALGGSATILATGLAAVAAVIAGMQLTGIVSSFGELREALDAAFPSAQKTAQELEKHSIWGKEAQQPIKGLAEAWREFSASLPSMANLAGPIGALKGFMESLTSTVKTLTGSFPEMDKVGTAALKKVQDANMAAAKAAGDHGLELAKQQKAHIDAAAAAGAHAVALETSEKRQRAIQKALQDFNTDVEGGSSKLAKLKADLDLLHGAWQNGEISTKAYWVALQAYNKAVADADPVTVALGKTLKDLGVTTDKLHSESFESLNQKIIALDAGLKSQKITQDQYNAAWEEIDKRLDHLVQPLYELDNAFKAMDASVKEASGSVKLHTLDVNALAAAYPNLTAAVRENDIAHHDAAASAILLREQINQMTDRMAKEVADVDRVRDAYKILGVESSDALRQKAISARQAYETIVQSGERSATVIHEAYNKMREAELAAMDPFSRAMQGAFTGLSQTVGSLVGGLFGGGLSGAQKSKIAGLTGDLGKASDDFAAFVDDINAQLNGLDARYQEAANKQIATEQNALNKKQAEFDKYAAEVATKLEGLDEKYQVAAAKQINSLNDGLAKQTLSYQRFVEDATESLEKVTRKHAEELEKQQRDAQRSLANKLKDLEDYRRDAETKLSRVTEDLAEKNRKEEQDYKDSLARKALDLDQYRATVQLKLQQLAGDNSASAQKQREDLLLSLQQREQDFLLWKNQAAAHLEAVTQANTTQANRQRADIQTSLAGRESDFNQYKIDTEAKITELSAAHAAKAEEERAAIQEKLQERTADFEQYKLDVQAKIEEAKQTAITKAQEERDGLLAKLNEKKADFDTYKTEMAAKIEEIKQTAITKAQEEKDGLLAKLKEKTDDFEQYKKDVNTKIEEIKTKNKTETDAMGGHWDTFQKTALGHVGTLASGAIGKLFKGPESWKEVGITEIPKVGGEFGKLKDTVTGPAGHMSAMATSLIGILSGPGSWKEKAIDAIGAVLTAFTNMADSWISKASGLQETLNGIFSAIKVPNLGGILNIGGGGTTTTPATTTGAPVDPGAIQSAVSGGISGVVTAISSVASAISGIVGNFQNARQENTLNAIEESTRYTKILTEQIKQDHWTREDHLFLKLDDWRTNLMLKLDDLWGTLLNIYDQLGGVSIGSAGGGASLASLQAIEGNINLLNDAVSGFRTEVSTGFGNAMAKADDLWGSLQTIADNTTPKTDGSMAVTAPNVEEGLRNINITGQGTAAALAPLVDIRDTLSAMRNNIGNIIGIKEAVVGQLGMIHGQIADKVVSWLGSIDTKLQPLYDYYRRITNSSSAIASTNAATTAISNATQGLATLATTVSAATQTSTATITSASNAAAAASTAATTATTTNTAAVDALTATVAVANAHTEETEAERRDREQRERENQARLQREREEDDRARRAQEEADRIAREREADRRARQAQEAADAAARARQAISQTQTASLSWLSTGSLQSLLAAARGGWLTQGTMASLGISGGFNRPGNNIEVNINGGVVDRDLVDEIGNILVARLRLAGQS